MSIQANVECEGIADMRDVVFIWDLPDDPDGNLQHMAEHDVDADEAEHVVLNGTQAISRSSGHVVSFAHTPQGDTSRSCGSTWMTTP